MATHNFPFTNLTEVGYQPTGINPFATLFPGTATSKTAMQLLFALAIYKRLFATSNARLLVEDPLGEFGYNAASNVSTTDLVFKSMMETELSFELHTYRYFPSAVTIISFGLSPTVIGAFHIFFSKSKIKTLSHPQQEI